MPFDKSPAELVARFDELADLVPESTRKQMFGYPSLVVDGHMFMGLFGDHLVLRLGDDDRAAILDQGGHEFAPMAGRPMTGYVVVPEALLADSEAMADWVVRSVGCARSLPRKKPRAAKKAKT